jgi:GNAT superfamily N-acetyltransferase
MGLLDPDLLRNKLKGLLGGMPLVQAAQGQAQVSQNGLLAALKAMPVFDAEGGAEDAYQAGAGLLGTLKPQGGFKSAREIMDAFEQQRGIDSYISEGLPGGRSGLTLSSVKVPKAERGKGLGSEFMEDLVNYADQTGQRVYLTPATDFGASSVARLKKFYKRFGFVENKGRNKDYTTREGMFRREGGE